MQMHTPLFAISANLIRSPGSPFSVTLRDSISVVEILTRTKCGFLYLEAKGIRTLTKHTSHGTLRFPTRKPPEARNRILFESTEVSSDGSINLSATDCRTQHIMTVLRSLHGDSIRIGVIGGRPGVAIVDTVSSADVALQLRVAEWGPLPAARRVSVILGMPRPKAMRRIWWEEGRDVAEVMEVRSILGQLGLSNVFITNANRVERFYFDCQALHPEVMRRELLIGLEQGVWLWHLAAQAADTMLPHVKVFQSFSKLLDEVAAIEEQDLASTPTPSASTNKTLLLAHPGGPSIYATLLQSNPPPHLPTQHAKEQCVREEGAAETEVWLAIGPEGGWSAEEVEVMSQRGFVLVGLGHRPLRTDVALVALVSSVKEAIGDW